MAALFEKLQQDLASGIYNNDTRQEALVEIFKTIMASGTMRSGLNQEQTFDAIENASKLFNETWQAMAKCENARLLHVAIERLCINACHIERKKIMTRQEYLIDREDRDLMNFPSGWD